MEPSRKESAFEIGSKSKSGEFKMDKVQVQVLREVNTNAVNYEHEGQVKHILTKQNVDPAEAKTGTEMKTFDKEPPNYNLIHITE